MSNSGIKAVIFDMDGVLVDSEPAHAQAWTDVLTSLGCHLPEGWYREWFGISDHIMAPQLMDRYHLDIPLADLRKRKHERAMHLLAHKVEPFPGVPEALCTFNHLRRAMCTSSSIAEVNIVFRRISLGCSFEVMITSEDVKNKKPAPDAYLLAADRLHLTPGECVVVEDTGTGIAAARRAGMQVIAVRNSQPDRLLYDAHAIVDTTPDAVEWIKKHY
jgi:HAD superfamily hydrolase (TIGR01509 family)